MITRRSFLASLAALPFIGRLFAQPTQAAFSCKLESFAAIPILPIGTGPLANLQAITVSISLREHIRTDEAINTLLTAIRWPKNKRHIAKGTTMLDRWFVDKQSAFDVISELITVEGPGAIFYEDAEGNLVFETGDDK